MRSLLPILALLAGCQVNVTPTPTPLPTTSPTASPTATPTATPTVKPTTSPSPSSAPSFPLGQSFEIKMSQTLSNADLRLTFSAVTESRCPSDVQCVWAGQAKTQLRFQQGAQGEDILLTLPAMSDKPVTSANGVYRFTAEDLKPYPKASQPKPASDYVLTLKVEKIK